MGALLKWLATVLRDWLNGYISPTWKADQEQLQKDAAAFQRYEARVIAEAAEIGMVIKKREVEAAKLEQERLKEKERIEKAESIEDVLGFPR